MAQKLYLCNKQKSCAGSMTCGALCNHTTDEAFAKNEPRERKFEKEVKADSDGILKIYMREVIKILDKYNTESEDAE